MGATLQSSIQLVDNFSGPMQKMVDSVTKFSQKMEDINKTSIEPMGISKLQSDFIKGELAIEKMKKSISNSTKPLSENIEMQNNWNRTIKDGNSSMDGLVNKIKGAIGIYASIQGIKKIVQLSDETAQIDAKLNFMVDTTEQKENLKNAIYKAAQATRVPLNDFANDVAKLGMLAGDRFKNNREIVDFNTSVAKSFKLSGTNAAEASGAITQLNQALISGVLQGDEYRSVRENAPMITQAIAKHMNVSQAELKKLASEGKITSNIVKNAVLEMSEDVSNKFAKLPKTWQDVWVIANNKIQTKLNSLLNYINKLANNEKFQNFINGIINAFNVLGIVATGVLKGLSKVASIIYNNWGFIEPIIYGVAGAVAYYGTVQAISAAKTGLATLATIGQNAALLGQIATEYIAIATTQGLAVAQSTLNAAVYAFPGTWLAMLLAGLVVGIVAVTLAIVKWATKTQTWTEVIVGSFYWVGGVIGNILLAIVDIAYTVLGSVQNGFAVTANFIGNVMRDPASAFINYVKDMAISSLNILQGFASAVDKVIGTNFAGNVEDWKGKVEGVASFLSKKFGNGKYKTIVENKSMSNELAKVGVKRINLGGMFDKGKSKGREWQEKLLGNKTTDKMNNDLGGKAGNNLDKIAKDGDKTKKNTGKMADKLEDTEEDLKYLRELAEQEHINQFTTAEIKIDMKNDNHIKNGMDLDDIVRELQTKVEEAMFKSANGVYN